MYHQMTATLLITTALSAGAALAQTSPTPSTMSPPATSAPMSAATSSATGKFVTDQAVSEFRASKFVGLDIYGSENEKVGDIKEILLDSSGAAKTVVIGVGGIMGLGEKNVAVAFSSIEWKLEKPMATTASTAAPRTGGTAMGGAPMTTSSTAPAAAPAMAAPARSAAEQAVYNGYPDHGMIKISKAELKDAPTFKYVADTTSSSGAPSNAMAPAKQ